MLNVLALYYVCIDFLSNNAIKSVFLNFFLTVKGKGAYFFFFIQFNFEYFFINFTVLWGQEWVY